VFKLNVLHGRFYHVALLESARGPELWTGEDHVFLMRNEKYQGSRSI